MRLPRRYIPVGSCAILLAILLICGCGPKSEQTAEVDPETNKTTSDPSSDPQDTSDANKEDVPPDKADPAKTPDSDPDGKGKQKTEEPDSQPPDKPDPVEPAMPHPFTNAVEAPPLSGGTAWLNTSGPLSLKDLRGKFVLLDFWTYCCINCMHVLPELKKLEHAFPNNVVVIGVHSAKFETEKGTENIREAILRYDIEHPVVNDSDMKIWDAYFCQSWPSLRLIDPEGKLVGGHSGEIEFEALERIIRVALPYYANKGVLDETPLQFNAERYRLRKTSPLFFPGKVLADEASGRLFIADSNHDRIVVCTLEGKLLEVIGGAATGLVDGSYAQDAETQPQFNDPQGMALKGDLLYVADNENHAIRKINLKTKEVTTIAGTGHQRRGWRWPGISDQPLSPDADPEMPERFVGSPKEEAISSPWALWIHGKDMYIAMAGPHQIWKMTLDEKEIGPYAGNGREDIVNGPLLPKTPYEPGYSSFAQPSGFTSDGEWLYVADSEGSSIRAVPFKADKEVQTIIGSDEEALGRRLFTFGDVDGAHPDARLQHCLGVCYYRDKLYVADTYNNKIKVVDVKEKTVKTLLGDSKPGKTDDPPRFDEPAGLAAAAGKLYVADTNNHLIRVVDLENGNKVSTLTIEGLAPPKRDDAVPPAVAAAQAKVTEVPASEVQAVDGKIRIAVELTLPENFKMNPLAPMRYSVEFPEPTDVIDQEAVPKWQRVDPPSNKFEVALPAKADAGEATIRLKLNYFYCSEGAEGVCKVGRALWSIPLKVSADGQKQVQLTHEVKD